MPHLPVVFVWGLKATPLLVGAWVLTLVLHRASAATRHVVWGLALGGSLALPAIALVAPRWEVVVPSHFRPAAPQAAAIPTGPVGPTQPAASSVQPSASGVSVGVPQTSGLTTSVRSTRFTALSATAVWASGAAVVAVLLLVSLLGTARLARRSRAEQDRGIHDEARRVARRLGIRRHVRLRRASGEAMPMTWGIMHPTVLLPAGVDRWPTGRREAVLLHELAHVKRWDWVTQLVARFVCALYWWHPLVWVGARRLREERELACDDLVLAAGTMPSAYAGDLLEIARGFRTSVASSLTAVAMARRSQLAGRLLAVLDATRSRTAPRRSHLVPAVGAAFVVLIPLAALATRGAERPFTGPARAAVNRVVGTVGTADSAEARAATLCDWSARSESSSSSTSVNDEHMMMQISRGDCTITVRAEGRIAGYASAPTGDGITFSDDDRDIARLPEHGYFEIEERSGRSRRRVEVTEESGGLARRWFVDGSERPYDDSARAWFGDALLVLARRSGINADARAVRIFESQGADGLIAEIRQLQSDYVAGKYYRVLFARAKLTSSQLAQLLDDAAGRIGSDYELGRVLATVAARGPLDATVQRAYVRASDRLGSDYEHGRALGALVAASDLDASVLDAILGSAGKIGSDYERARLMLAVAERYPSGRPLPATYLSAIGGMSSDYERGRVLTALLDRDQLSSDDRARVLEVVEQIGSDHTRGEVLRGVVERGRLDSSTRPAFFRTVGSIGSSYERQQVLAAVVRSAPDEETMLAVLDAVRDIDSDHSKAEVLVATANRLNSDRLRAAYVKAAETIGSNYDRDRALRAAGLRRG